MGEAHVQRIAPHSLVFTVEPLRLCLERTLERKMLETTCHLVAEAASTRVRPGRAA